MLEVLFGANSILSEVEEFAFAGCRKLASVCFPSSVTSLGRQCFHASQALTKLSFGSPCRVRSLPPSFCDGCSSLLSIVIPASVETIGQACFARAGLRSLTFEPESRLVRVEANAFSFCQIPEFCIPATVEFIGMDCFQGCFKLVNLTFSTGSRLRELLGLPPQLPNTVNIPDSVEQLVLPDSLLTSGGRVIEFGPGSKLARVTIKASGMPSMLNRMKVSLGWRPGGFLRLTPRCLKALRANLEFQEPLR
jgi:hypothetical protein